MIIVTGANGQLGRATVEQLLGRIPAKQIGVSVRDPEKAQGLAERGVRVRPGDFADAPSLAQLIGRPPTSLRDVLAAADLAGQVTAGHR